MLFDNGTSWGNGPRYIIRDYLNHYHSKNSLKYFFGLVDFFERFYLEEEFDENESYINELEYIDLINVSSFEREIAVSYKHYIKNKTKARETVRDFLNGYRVTKQQLMNYFGIVKRGNCYILFEELKYQ